MSKEFVEQYQSKEQPSLIDRVEHGLHAAWDHLMGNDVVQMKKEAAAATEADRKILPAMVIEGADQEVYKAKVKTNDDIIVQKKLAAAEQEAYAD